MARGYLVVGFTFKEDCPDTRNTKVIDMLSHVRDWGMQTEVVDTWAHVDEVLEEHGLNIGRTLPESEQTYDALTLAVPHSDVVTLGAERLRRLLRPGGILFDMKAAFGIYDSDLRL